MATFGMLHEIGGDLLVIIVCQRHLGYRPIAKIKITGKPGIPRQMRFLIPQHVAARGVIERFCQPRQIVLSARFLGLIHGENHRTQKRWLRAGEMICAIGIKHRSVVFDLVEEVLDHALRQVNPAIAQQATNNKVTIPTIHFVEHAARHHVAMLQIQQSVGSA